MRLSKWLGLVPFFLTTVYAQDTSIDTVRRAFVDANIPRDINIPFNPQFLLEVVLPQNNSLPILVHAGIQLPREQTAITPRFSLIDPSDPLHSNAGPGPFLIAAIDPDAPTPQDPTNAQVRHFLGGDFFPIALPPQVPGGGTQTPVLRNRTAGVSEWRQPTPGGGNHRYIFLAFNQPQDFDARVGQFVNATTPAPMWDLEEFREQVGLGDPIAGTFMMVANPDNP